VTITVDCAGFEEGASVATTMTVVILVLVLAFVHLDSAAATVLFDPVASVSEAGAMTVVVERNFSTAGGSGAEAAEVVEELEAEAVAIVEFALELEAEAAAIDCAVELEAEAAAIVDSVLELAAATACSEIMNLGITLL
jgi:hypothetical protein